MVWWNFTIAERGNFTRLLHSSFSLCQSLCRQHADSRLLSPVFIFVLVHITTNSDQIPGVEPIYPISRCYPNKFGHNTMPSLQNAFFVLEEYGLMRLAAITLGKYMKPQIIALGNMILKNTSKSN